MKIVHKSNSQLIITHNPWKVPLLLLLWALLTIYMFIKQYNALETGEFVATLIGILFLLFSSYLTSKKENMKFNTDTNTVTWYKDGLFKEETGSFPLDSIENVINHHKEDMDGTSYRVEVILSNNERIPVVSHYSTVERQEEVAKELREWLGL